MYTLCNEAYETGVPAVRGLVLEYPNDPVTWGTFTQYEFLLGKSFLVAPVYRDEEKRDTIYLPEGTWYDYWDGTVYQGKTTLNNYSAPLDKLPLFVKGGSVIPMYQQMFFDGERQTDTLTLDIYPGENTEFEMFEDDGSTREYRKGNFARTKLTFLINPLNKEQITEITISGGKGTYNGEPERRIYTLQIHSKNIPKQILVQAGKLKKFKNRIDFDKSKTGWYFNPDDRNGIVNIKTDYLSTGVGTAFKLSY
jgi:alpha-glucosidase (family GH31 glycosyl hydrolase)